MKINKNLKFIFLALISSLFFMPELHAQTIGQVTSTVSTAVSNADIGTMFANGQASFDAIIKLLKIASYIIGIYLVVGSIFKFSQLGTQRDLSVHTPLVMFFSGIGIFALVGTISIATATLAMGSGPGDIFVTGNAGWTAQTNAAMKGVLTFIRMVGYIAFIRGWLMINAYGQGGHNGQGKLGRGLTHIFGGVAAINVTITAHILANTFAPGVPMPF